MTVVYTDEQIGDISEPAGRLVQANGLYVNQLIVTDMRDAYELAITYRENRLTAQAVEIERLRTEHQAILIWAKLVYRWLSTYFAVPPGFMKDVPTAVIRER